jgi:hypothetical protein
LHGGEVGEAGAEGDVVEGDGMKLEVEPAVESHSADSIEIAGTRAEGEAIEGVKNALVALKLGAAGLSGSGWLVLG